MNKQSDRGPNVAHGFGKPIDCPRQTTPGKINAGWTRAKTARRGRAPQGAAAAYLSLGSTRLYRGQPHGTEPISETHEDRGQHRRADHGTPVLQPYCRPAHGPSGAFPPEANQQQIAPVTTGGKTKRQVHAAFKSACPETHVGAANQRHAKRKAVIGPRSVAQQPPKATGAARPMRRRPTVIRPRLKAGAGKIRNGPSERRAP